MEETASLVGPAVESYRIVEEGAMAVVAGLPRPPSMQQFSPPVP